MGVYYICKKQIIMRTINVVVSVLGIEVRDGFTLLKVESLAASEDGIKWFKPTEVINGRRSPLVSLAIDTVYYSKIVGETPMFEGQILSVNCDERIAGVTEYLNEETLEVCKHYQKDVNSGKKLLGDTRLSPTYLYQGDVHLTSVEGISDRQYNYVIEKFNRAKQLYELKLLK